MSTKGKLGGGGGRGELRVCQPDPVVLELDNRQNHLTGTNFAILLTPFPLFHRFISRTL